ncbi:MAG TPA: DUF2917 domain-containing protein [Burkholderiaceae bacterium]|nr:DUF2917 domain-containing protein [Burkholderiaceae bacterium]
MESRPRTRIRVIHGGVWLTSEGDPSDRFPASGEEAAVQAKGRSIVESLGVRRLEITAPRGASVGA